MNEGEREESELQTHTHTHTHTHTYTQKENSRNIYEKEILFFARAPLAHTPTHTDTSDVTLPAELSQNRRGTYTRGSWP